MGIAVGIAQRCFVRLAVLAALSPSRSALAQYCIGATSYIIRDEAGAVMSAEQLEHLSVRINGVPTRVRTDSTRHQRYLEYETFDPRVDDRLYASAVSLTNPLTFGISGPRTACGQLGDLTITSRGKVMHLLFDIREHNTSFVIDGLPFREGTFHLGSLECSDAARPPLIDNRTTGACRVPAESWEGADKDWVRYVIGPVGRGFAGRTGVPPEQCRAKPALDAITERATSDSLLAAYPSLNQGNAGFARDVDFRVQFLIAVHQTIGATYSLRSFKVDKQGDLTYEPPSHAVNLGSCTAMYVALFRSGIRSIDGIPLRPASISR